MSALTVFGLFAVSAMLLCYALEDRGPLAVLGFAAACALGSTYGFLQGAWPFGLVEAVWAIVAVRRWSRVRRRSILPGVATPRTADRYYRARFLCGRRSTRL